MRQIQEAMARAIDRQGERVQISTRLPSCKLIQSWSCGFVSQVRHQPTANAVSLQLYHLGALSHRAPDEFSTLAATSVIKDYESGTVAVGP